jgi:hypothetical protein
MKVADRRADLNFQFTCVPIEKLQLQGHGRTIMPMNTGLDPPFALSAHAIDVRVTRHSRHLEAVVSGFKSSTGAVTVVAMRTRQ